MVELARLTRGCALALAVLGALCASLARADVRDEVVRALSAEQRRADLIVLLDTSGSMERHFAEVKRFAADLAALARPGDTLTFIAFAGKGSELMPPVTMRPGARKDVLARLSKLRPPQGLYTDLGAGLEATLDALLRPDYAPQSLVFLITDFCAEPPPQSPFTGAREGKGPCRQVSATPSLRKKSARLLGGGDQAVRVFALTLEPTSEAGLAATRDALGSLVRVDVQGGDLERALDGIRQRLEYERAALVVERMLAHPPISIEAPSQALWLEGERAIDLSLVSRIPFAANVRVTGLRTLDDSVRFELDGPARALSLAAARPKAGTTASIRVRGQRTSRTPLPVNAVAGEPFAAVQDLEVELALEVELLPVAPLEKLLGAPPRAHGTTRQKLAVRFVPPDAKVAPLVLAAPAGQPPLELAPGAEAQVALALRSLAPWAALDVRCTVNGRATEAVRLEPEARLPLRVRVNNDVRPRRFRLATTESRALPLRGSCAVSAITRSGVAVPWGTYPVATSMQVTWREGVPLAPALSVLLALLLAAALSVRELRLRVAPAALSGRLVVYAGPGKFQRVTVPLRGLVRLSLQGGVGGREGEVRLDGDRLLLPGAEAALLELYAEKAGRARVMRLRLLRGKAQLDERVLDDGPVLVQKGRARFSVGEYQCRIER
jgi:hypothetical protein